MTIATQDLDLLIGSEQMLINDISTNDLTVARGLNGTTGAAHSDDSDIYILRWPASVERAALIQTARIWTRAADFEPFFVDADVDTDIRILLEPYKESRFNPPTLFPIPDRWSVRSALPLACLLEPQKRVRKGR